MSKYKIAVVIPFFGKLPSYFSAWMKSAEFNKDIDFLLFSDCEIKSKSENIHHYSTTFEEVVSMYEKKLKRKINLKKPYKLCDYKVLIGFLYEDYLKEYDFWGWGDIDLMYGDIRHFVTDEILEKYDRIYQYGHLSLMRNTPEMNRLWLKSGSLFKLNDIFANEFNMGFNEYCGMNAICIKNNVLWYTDVDFADFCLYLNERLEASHGIPNYNEQIFVWENGHVYQYFKKDSKINKRELVYMHWQKRNPIADNDIMEKKCVVLTNEKLIGFDNINEVLSNLFTKFNPTVTAEERVQQKKSYNKKKMNDFWKSPLKKKKIWISRKIFLKTHINKKYK